MHYMRYAMHSHLHAHHLQIFTIPYNLFYSLLYISCLFVCEIFGKDISFLDNFLIFGSNPQIRDILLHIRRMCILVRNYIVHPTPKKSISLQIWSDLQSDCLKRVRFTAIEFCIHYIVPAIVASCHFRSKNCSFFSYNKFPRSNESHLYSVL